MLSATCLAFGVAAGKKQIAGVIDKILADRALSHAADHCDIRELHGIRCATIIGGFLLRV